MSTYEERLVTFSSWPHASPSPEDMAKAGFRHEYMLFKDPDTVKCQVCNTQLCDWEPVDDPLQEHYRCSKSCMRFSESDPMRMMFVYDTMASPPEDAQVSLQVAPQKAPSQPSPKDIGFLDLSLQHDFPDLCLFHDAHTFCDRIEHCRSESGFLGADILELLPKCLRGEALKWFKQSECQDLAVCIQALKARFPQASQRAPQSSQEAPQQASSQAASQPIDYHHCKLCNASFSSIARLMRHTQEDLCDKPSCRHCDMVFSSKNRLHQHLREECQKQIHKRSSTSPSPAYSPTCSPKSSFQPSPSPPPEENRASLSPSPLPPSPPPKYRTISPPPPTYRNYLTIADLYARYAPRYLKIDDLFRMFRRRSAQSSTIPTSTRSSGIPTAPTTPATPKHLPIRHRGRCLAKKGDGSTQIPKHLPKHLTKQQPTQKTKIHFIGTPLQLTPYKSVLPLRRSHSISYPIATPYSPSSHTRAPP